MRFNGADALNALFTAPSLTFDRFVVAFGIGIAFYFGLNLEPDWRIVAISFGIVSGGIFHGRNRDSAAWAWIFFAGFIAMGFGRAVWHSHAVESPKLPPYERAYDVSGWLETINASGKGVSWHIVIDDIAQLEAERTPHRVRVRLGRKYRETAQASDYVKVRAILSAPPGPVVPGGYNPARRAFFDKIGGFGYAISIPEVQTQSNLSVPQYIARLRFGLAKHISEIASQQTAGLQAALLTGVRRYIPPEQTEALRAAGLAHILAISGLHMGLLAGSAFFVFTYVLAAIPALARRYDVRKFAAILAIIAAAAYLVLSGASVATQRAFIMAVIIFIAVVMDRQAISVRSVSVAAFITLFLHPESLISVGFQMSFAAVLALVIVYRYWQDKHVYTLGPKWVDRIKKNFVSLAMTSLVAGFATAGFALFHFGRIARFGLLGNLLAMPIFTFAVMPLGIISLIALPLGLEHYPLWMMGQALRPILSISEWVASLEGAMAYVRQAPNWVVAAYGFAFIGLLIGRIRTKYISIVLLICVITTWGRVVPPDIRVSQEGRVAFWENTQYQRLIVTSERADRYGREQFSEKAGQGSAELAMMNAIEAPCDALACRFDVKGKILSILNHPSEARIECAQSDIVILTQRDVGPEVRRYCKALLIDGRILRAGGAQEIYVSKGMIKRVETKKPTAKRRLWD